MNRSPWQAEIVQLHDFFQGWLGGVLPPTDAVFARLVDALAPSFALITPSGEVVGREVLLEQLRAAHASRPGWTLWIEQPELRLKQGDLTLATYEEWQRQADGTVSGRISTVVFRRQLGTPNGLAWLHVHETWLPGATQSREQRARDGL